jgi:hypothetical protein
MTPLGLLLRSQGVAIGRMGCEFRGNFRAAKDGDGLWSSLKKSIGVCDWINDASKDDGSGVRDCISDASEKDRSTICEQTEDWAAKSF